MAALPKRRVRRHDPTHRQWADLIGTGQPWAWAKATLSRPRGRAVSISSPVSPGVRTVPAREAGKSTWRWAIARLTLSSDILPTPPQASAGDPSRFPRSAQPSYRLRTSPSLQSPCTDHILSPTTAYDDRPRIANSSYDPKTYTPLAHRPPQSACPHTPASCSQPQAHLTPPANCQSSQLLSSSSASAASSSSATQKRVRRAANLDAHPAVVNPQ